MCLLPASESDSISRISWRKSVLGQSQPHQETVLRPLLRQHLADVLARSYVKRSPETSVSVLSHKWGDPARKGVGPRGTQASRRVARISLPGNWQACEPRGCQVPGQQDSFLPDLPRRLRDMGAGQSQPRLYKMYA